MHQNPNLLGIICNFCRKKRHVACMMFVSLVWSWTVCEFSLKLNNFGCWYMSSWTISGFPPSFLLIYIGGRAFDTEAWYNQNLSAFEGLLVQSIAACYQKSFLLDQLQSSSVLCSYLKLFWSQVGEYSCKINLGIFFTKVYSGSITVLIWFLLSSENVWID